MDFFKRYNIDFSVRRRQSKEICLTIGKDTFIFVSNPKTDGVLFSLSTSKPQTKFEIPYDKKMIIVDERGFERYVGENDKFNVFMTLGCWIDKYLSDIIKRKSENDLSVDIKDEKITFTDHENHSIVFIKKNNEIDFYDIGEDPMLIR